MPQILIIADDLTGAADAGARFAHAGLLTLVALAPAAQCPQSDVLVVSTESRHLAPDEAATRARLVASRIQRECKEKELSCIYKKIDSTLRGHPEPELVAIMDALDLERALVAPAFPAQGRTTLSGRQQVNGVPIERTPFGQDVHSSDLRVLFDTGSGGRPVRLIELKAVRLGSEAVCQVLRATGPGVVVADAETDADLTALARAALTCGVRLLCGSAGLARALVDLSLYVPAAAAPLLPARLPGPILVVAGSRHPHTARQVEVARERGALVVRPDSGLLRADGGQAVQQTTENVRSYLAGGQNVILTLASLGDSPLGGQVVAARLAQVAQGLAAERRVGGLILTGGDIAAAVCAALEASAFWLRGEVQPGIAWGVLIGGLLPGLPIVTKAGAFGANDALTVAINHLDAVKANQPAGRPSN